MEKDKIYSAIDGERWYQDKKWGVKKNQVAAWILFMEHHLGEAKKYASVEDNDDKALDSLRKVTALGVACFEEHGLPLRDITDGIKEVKKKVTKIKPSTKVDLKFNEGSAHEEVYNG